MTKAAFTLSLAIQLATSIELGANYFLTNNTILKAISETTVAALGELQ